MIYNLKNNNHYNFNIIQDKRLPSRSYFIPFGSKEKCIGADYLKARALSDKVVLLSGQWDFQFYSKGISIPQTIDTDKIKFDRLVVPSCWQMKGYEKPFYVNIRYPFNCSPPHIPYDRPVGRYYDILNRKSIDARDVYNSAGIYRKTIDIAELDKVYIISFLGVSSCLELYVNGNYAGYSESSHNTSEFDITAYLRKGSNEILVIVHKWCNGSYLECQDMFRHNGIFRDVLLYVNDRNYIYDYHFKTAYSGDGEYSIDLMVNTENCEGCSLDVSLELNGKTVYCQQAAVKGGMTEFSYKDKFIEYNPERPVLYDLFLTLSKEGRTLEVIHKKAGFKRIEISGGVLYYNGKGIKIKGVNHHDTNPYTGFTMTAEDMYKDVTLMKEHNVNAVRTAHYPPDPLFVEICDREGLYVIAEADIETHGASLCTIYFPNRISGNKAWKGHYLDRVERMYNTFKNNPSIFMWSLGNEAGGIVCQDYCYDYLKKVTDIPVHYEGACRTRRIGYDVFSYMYPPIHLLKAFHSSRRRSLKDKPIFLCEYAHAMGTGPGNLKEYMDVFESSEHYLGGCIWEFRDHAIFHKEGRYDFTYGGDHGEYVHDGNFCVDGLFSPLNKPHIGALNMKYEYRPIKSVLSDGRLIITNCNFFADTSDIEIRYEIQSDGEIIKKGLIDAVISPREKADFPLESIENEGDTYINVIYTDKIKGGIIAKEQHCIHSSLIDRQIPQVKISSEEKDGEIIFSFDKGSIILDSKTGEIKSYKIKGRELISEQFMLTNVNRPHTDNSRISRLNGYKNTFIKLIDCKIEINKDSGGFKDAVITYVKEIFAKKKAILKAEEELIIGKGGVMDLTLKLIPLSKLKDNFECYGHIFRLQSEFDNISYYGRGKGSSYPDIKMHCPIGIYQLKADEFSDSHIRPQESGNRCDVRYAAITDDKGSGILINALDKALNISVKKHSDNAIDTAAHIEDLNESNGVYVSINGEVSGVGSGSCGPGTLDKYTIPKQKEYVFRYRIMPVINK